MSKEDALSMSDEAGGIVFSGAIFGDLVDDVTEKVPVTSAEKAPVTSVEVIDLITELNDVLVLPGDLGAISEDNLTGRAADAIGSLVVQVAELEHAAKPKYEMSREVGCLIADLRKELSSGMGLTLTDGQESLIRNSIDALVELSREKMVTGEIQGGVLTLDNVPEGVVVEIRDYDVGDGGAYEDAVSIDDQGHQYVGLTWGRIANRGPTVTEK